MSERFSPEAVLRARWVAHSGPSSPPVCLVHSTPLGARADDVAMQTPTTAVIEDGVP
jgi:hypothetical protein